MPFSAWQSLRQSLRPRLGPNKGPPAPTFDALLTDLIQECTSDTMSRAKPIRLSDGRLYTDARPRSLEVREPLERAVTDALFKGVPVVLEGRRRFHLGWTPRCEAPYRWLAFGSRSEYARGSRNPIYVQGFGRCRKCTLCKKARSDMWQIRAMNEYARWPRTLFGTITMSMEEHYRLDSIIIQGTRGKDGRYIRHPQNPAAMSADEIFAARVGVFGDEVQRFLKRLRKGDLFHPAPSLRYLIVAEAHESERTNVALRGRPHFHIMLHETVASSLVHGNPVIAITNGTDGEYRAARYQTKTGEWRSGVFVDDGAFLRKQWHFGFTKFQFAENARAAAYLCKYLNKAADERIRASVGYGIHFCNARFPSDIVLFL